MARVPLALTQLDVDGAAACRSEKAREPLGVSAQRLVSPHCGADWPAQPLPEASADYLDPLTIVAGGGDGPNGAPAIIFLVYVGRDIALQDHRAEVVAEEAAHRELALLQIAQNWLIQIPGTV